MEQDQGLGVAAEAARPAVPSGPEPAAQSQPEALVPNAEDAVRSLLALLTSGARWDKAVIDNAAAEVRKQLPPEPDAPLKSVVTFAADYGPLGRVSITLPECNGGDAQFDADFEATLDFVRGVVTRRKSARASAMSARSAETEGLSPKDASAVPERQTP